MSFFETKSPQKLYINIIIIYFTPEWLNNSLSSWREITRPNPFPCSKSGSAMVQLSPSWWIMVLRYIDNISENKYNLSFVIFHCTNQTVILLPMDWCLYIHCLGRDGSVQIFYFSWFSSNGVWMIFRNHLSFDVPRNLIFRFLRLRDEIFPFYLIL